MQQELSRCQHLRQSRFILASNHAVPTSACMQARAKELRAELLNSKRLEAHFEAHPGKL